MERRILGRMTGHHNNPGRVVLLSGGVGGARLARGLQQVVEPEHLTVVVNVGDDDDVYGVRVCADLDTVLITRYIGQSAEDVYHPGAVYYGVAPAHGAAHYDRLVTIEENVVMGGAGSGVNEYLQETACNIPVLNLGLPDHFVEHGSSAQLLAECGLDADSIVASIERHQQNR